MYFDEFNAVCNAAKGKINFMENNTFGYMVSSITAGFFIAFGSFVTFTLGTPLNAAGSPMLKAVQAFAFAAALSLVIMAGAELFTGNNMVLGSASFNGCIPWGKTVKAWILCYVGNILGSLLGVAGFQLTGVPKGDIGAYFAQVAAAKMSLTPVQLLVRGIFCNILVCLAVWCALKMKSESGKLIMVFWCIFVFMICGFEHSVANMSILAVGLLNAGDAAVSIGGYFYNLLFVTIGNMIGGVFFVAGPYHVMTKTKSLHG